MTPRIRPVRWLATVLATAVALWLVARASAVALPWHAADAARVRMSWSARPERIESCRALTAEEIEKEPPHMRRHVECTGTFATYLLHVASDGRVIDERIVKGGGIRNDRPMYLLADYDLMAGEHRIRVKFTRREKTDDDSAAVVLHAARTDTDSGIFAGRAEREDEERARRRRAAVPAIMEMDTLLTLAPGQVKLITFDAEARQLVIR
ncbi:MAG TPA: hypothetical protein VFR95_08415 [Gemmatimonadaceae bacterium]|nr:hypothetical protein [Gemmatimonadaceae bacterium]